MYRPGSGSQGHPRLAMPQMAARASARPTATRGSPRPVSPGYTLGQRRTARRPWTGFASVEPQCPQTVRLGHAPRAREADASPVSLCRSARRLNGRTTLGCRARQAGSRGGTPKDGEGADRRSRGESVGRPFLLAFKNRCCRRQSPRGPRTGGARMPNVSTKPDARRSATS